MNTTDFVNSLIDGSRQASDMAEAKRLMATGRPAKKRIKYFPRNETASDVATLVGVTVDDNDTFAIYKTAYHLGM